MPMFCGGGLECEVWKTTRDLRRVKDVARSQTTRDCDVWKIRNIRKRGSKLIEVGEGYV